MNRADIAIQREPHVVGKINVRRAERIIIRRSPLMHFYHAIHGTETLLKLIEGYTYVTVLLGSQDARDAQRMHLGGDAPLVENRKLHEVHGSQTQDVPARLGLPHRTQEGNHCGVELL